MLPSQRSESLNAISNGLASLNLGSASPKNDGHRNQMKTRLRSSKTSDCLMSNKSLPCGVQFSKPVLSGGVKKHTRHNFSFTNNRFHEIQRENRRLLGEILKKTTSLPNGIRQRPKRPSSASFSPVMPIMKNSGRRVSAPNTNSVSFYVRQKERQRIELENLALHRRLQSIRTGSSNGISYSRGTGQSMKRASSIPRFASHERLDYVNETEGQLGDENISSFEI